MAQEAVAPEGAVASAEDEDEAEGVEPAGWGRCAAAHDAHTQTHTPP